MKRRLNLRILKNGIRPCVKRFRFPTLRANQSSSHSYHQRSRSTDSLNVSSSRRKRRAQSSLPQPTWKRGKPGRPQTKTIIYKDLVIIPNPDTTRVPTHANRVDLETKGLIVSEFLFDKSWDASTLKEKVREQLPQTYLPFQFVKVRSKYRPSIFIGGVHSQS